MSQQLIQTSFRLPKELHTTLRKLAIDEKTPVQTLYMEGVQMVLAKRGIKIGRPEEN